MKRSFFLPSRLLHTYNEYAAGGWPQGIKQPLGRPPDLKLKRKKAHGVSVLNSVSQCGISMLCWYTHEADVCSLVMKLKYIRSTGYADPISKNCCSQQTSASTPETGFHPVPWILLSQVKESGFPVHQGACGRTGMIFQSQYQFRRAWLWLRLPVL